MRSNYFRLILFLSYILLMLACLPERNVLVVNCTDNKLEVVVVKETGDLNSQSGYKIVGPAIKVEPHCVATMEKVIAETKYDQELSFLISRDNGEYLIRKVTLKELKNTNFTLIICQCEETK